MGRRLNIGNFEYLIAVYDIGKTNKKFKLFTDDLKPVFSTSTRIEEIKVKGIICDDVESIIKWMQAVIEKIPKDQVKSIAITTFGATGVLLDEKGELALPVVSYNQEISPEIKNNFYKTFGTPEELYLKTGTPPYGQLLNFGVQLFWHKEVRPEVYERTKSILFLPQYLSYIMSGVKSIEVTSVGCHTYLYDITKQEWSHVAEYLEVPERAPEGFTSVWEPIGKSKWFKDALITTGIHDSNASLLPFLVTGGIENFILASTGTWCVFMCPGLPFKPSPDDVYRDVLYYIDAFGRPVRSSRFKGGYEFDYYMDLLRKKFNLGNGIIDMDVDERILKTLLRNKEVFIVPTLALGSGQFPKSRGRVIGEKTFYKDFKLAYHVLNLSIAVQTYFAIKVIFKSKSFKGLKVIVAGGFAKNTLYLRLLTAILRDAKIFKTQYPDLTSLGTALTAKAAYEGILLNQIDKEIVKRMTAEEAVKPLEISEELIESYIDEFEKHCLAEPFK